VTDGTAVVLMGDRDRQRGIRDRWTDSQQQRAAARAAVELRDLSLANDDVQLEERGERLGRRRLRLEGIVDQDDSVWSSFFDVGLTVARAVGRVVVARGRQPVRPVGTGSLITDRLLLTNHHVCPAPQDAAEMAVQFGYEYDAVGGERLADQRALDPDVCFVTDPELDFTLVAVADRDGQPPGTLYGCLQLIEQTGKAVIGEVVNVIHHPAGERKRVSLRDNRLVAMDDLWLRYESDTREGSSGAPVFNDQWELIALHHGGVPATDDEGFELARDGRRWTDDMGEEQLAFSGNEGARVSRIVRSLRATVLAPEQRALLATVLEQEE
jgi:V8-like Glu-specific endopeptidase